MNTLSRTISGIITIIFGGYILFLGFSHISENWPSLIWGTIFLIIGFFILFNKKEDNIEEIKNKDLIIKNNIMSNLIITTGNEIPGKKIVKILDLVKGSTVRSRNIGRDIGAGVKSLIGGEVKTYTEMTMSARDEAYNRMINQAIELGADAIINVRFTTSMVMTGASEMLAYGTAVKISDLNRHNFESGKDS